jgi:hypothetical protein
MTAEQTEPGTAVEKVPAGNRRRPTVGDRKAKGTTAAKAQAAGARKPADHASAKTDVEAPKAIEIEWHGHKYVIEPDAFDDLEFVEAMLAVDDPKVEDAERAIQAFKGVKILLGPEGFEQYKDNERSETGRVSFSGVMTFFEHLMDETNRKNSQSSSTS